MKASQIKISKQFRKMAVRSIGAILLFMVTYFVLVSLAVLFALACGYAAVMLVILKAMFATIMLGLGLISLGILVLIFLVKFMFNKNKTDRSHLMEITKANEQKLFKFIAEIVSDVKTDFPKRIYLSADVNASVFYDSSFWSMFLPVKKNLQIGLGLMNTVSKQELKAILAHEFGHFSQRSMKVGSYVYNVNRVLHDMLYDNGSYSEMMAKWSGTSNYFNLFAGIAVKMITGIQFLLKKVYEVVNLNYLGLSREMEFHADAVAAEVAGSQALIDSLLRLELADQSLNEVFNYYNTKFEEAEKTDNFYPQQHYVMTFMATKYQLEIENDLPKVNPDSYSRFNKSKLVLKDQWSSHPSTQDRIKALKLLNKVRPVQEQGIASELLMDAEAVQKQFTARLFDAVQYPKPPVVQDFSAFQEEYSKTYNQHVFPEVYKGYFNDRSPVSAATESAFLKPAVQSDLTLEVLFSEETLDLMYTSKSIEADLAALEQIGSGDFVVKSFDYDGHKYTPADCPEIIEQLNKELEALNEKLSQKDLDIFYRFYSDASHAGKLKEFKQMYQDYQRSLDLFLRQKEIYTDLGKLSSFTQVSMPFEEIRQNLKDLKWSERFFIEQIRTILGEEWCKEEIDDKTRGRFERYLEQDWKYFAGTVYFDHELDLLFIAMNDFLRIIARIHYLKKNSLLTSQLDYNYSSSSLV
ncbi:hypothetical protein DBR11_08690 [Pedobacter sp. HMWF019]|uniref:M48 family metalloprotease n=1 Tax=Pedobacter sp. HMWF019 TaxID=2056856 RepID=UPI000D393F3C|nr:M48 family metallopeptidase [Pedobacter sp. HMWF019]PTT00906.1 hypothetical protein DBR11_08690 [Pedobacter sp. HMWF019]